MARPFTAFIDDTNTLKLKIELPKFSSKVDLYAGVYFPWLDPDHVYQITSDLKFDTSNTPVKWKSSVSTAVESSLWGDIDAKLLNRAEYFLYLDCSS